jgi:carboxypeptidase T
MARFIVRITASSYEQLRNLDRFHLDLKKRTARQEGANKFIVTGFLTGEQIEEVKNAGYAVEVLSDLTQASKERMQEVSKANRFSKSKSTSEMQKSAETGGYMNADEVETALTSLTESYQDFITLVELPNRTHENRLCRAVRVHASSGEKPGLLITGGVHAREWGGSDICINFLTNLIHAYVNKDTLIYGEATFPPAQIENMLKKIELIVFPDVNPDGKIYSQTNDDPNLPPDEEGIWWRKNRNPQPVPKIDNPEYHKVGVDINRNFDFLWGSGIGTVNTDGTNMGETFRGTTAFSEPETKNVKYLFDTYSNIGYYVDIHSFGQMILYSWGDDVNQSLDPNMNFLNPKYEKIRGNPKDIEYKEYMESSDEKLLKNLANRMNYALNRVRGSNYRVEQSVGLYPTSATSDDYAYSRHVVNNNSQKIYGFTIEFGKEDTGFIPPFSEMKEVMKEVSCALTEFCITVAST